MLTIPAHVIHIGTTDAGAEVDLVLGEGRNISLTVDVTIAQARQLGPYLAEDLELVLQTKTPDPEEVASPSASRPATSESPARAGAESSSSPSVEASAPAAKVASARSATASERASKGESETPEVAPRTGPPTGVAMEGAGAHRTQEDGSNEVAIGPRGPGSTPRRGNTGRAAPARAPKTDKTKVCVACGEDKKIKARGMCGLCYGRARRGGHLQGPRRASLRQLLRKVGESETTRRLGCGSSTLAEYLDGVREIPGSVAQHVGRELGTLAQAEKGRRVGKPVPVFRDEVPPPAAGELAEARAR